MCTTVVLPVPRWLATTKKIGFSATAAPSTTVHSAAMITALPVVVGEHVGEQILGEEPVGPLDVLLAPSWPGSSPAPARACR